MDDPTPTTSGGGFGGPPSSGNVKIPYKVKKILFILSISSCLPNKIYNLKYLLLF